MSAALTALTGAHVPTQIRVNTVIIMEPFLNPLLVAGNPEPEAYQTPDVRPEASEKYLEVLRSTYLEVASYEMG